MAHHLTVAAMYASKAAEAGLIIRNRTTNYITEIQKQNDIHKDTIDMLVVRLEEFVSDSDVYILCIVFSLASSFYLSLFLDLTLIYLPLSFKRFIRNIPMQFTAKRV